MSKVRIDIITKRLDFIRSNNVKQYNNGIDKYDDILNDFIRNGNTIFNLLGDKDHFDTVKYLLILDGFDVELYDYDFAKTFNSKTVKLKIKNL